MSNEMLRHLAIMYVNRMDKGRKCEEEQSKHAQLWIDAVVLIFAGCQGMRFTVVWSAF